MIRKPAFMALLATLAIGVSSFADTVPTLDFQKIGADLTTTMLKCPERMWPNYNWKSVNVMMATEAQSPVIWRGQTGQTSPLPSAQVPAGAFDGTYSFPPFEGSTAVALYFTSDDLKGFAAKGNTQAFQTIVHEGFHNFGQIGWTGTSDQRGTLYPISSKPRLYRRMIFDRLKEYFGSAGKSSASLATAAYWNAKWKAEFPEEFRNSVDNIEGTANYIEILAPLIADGGCQISERDVFIKLVRAAYEQMGFSVSGAIFQLDREGYDLGALAGFILQFINRDLSWHEQVAKGSSPLDVLLAKVSPAKDQIPLYLVTRFQKVAIEQNKTLSSWLDTDLALVKNPDTIRIAPSDGSFQTGAYSPKGFYQSSSLPGTLMLPLALGVEFHNHGWKLNVAAEKVMFSGLAGPCVGHHTMIVPQASASVANGRIEVHGNGVDGSMTGVVKTDANGFKWFCETEATVGANQ